MRKTVVRILLGCIVALMVPILLSAVSVSWFLAPGGKTDGENIDGEIGLRSYFYQGSGSSKDPYEITEPRHLHNLIRLQNLGVFSTKRFFQIGHEWTEGVPLCGTDAEHTVPYLDMSTWNYSSELLKPIGSEAVPFYGEFNGNNLPIKGLCIAGNPEDIGLFGYVTRDPYDPDETYMPQIHDLICEDLKVTSLGFSLGSEQSESNPNDYTLYSKTVEELFNSTDFTDSGLTFHDENSGRNPTIAISTTGSQISAINASGAYTPILSEGENPTTKAMIYNGYFTCDLPQKKSGTDVFTYDWSSTSPLLKKTTKTFPIIDENTHEQATDPETGEGLTEEKEVMVFDLLPLMNNEEFASDEQKIAIKARISLRASTVVGNLTFTRVIKSFTLQFENNKQLWSAGKASLAMFTDYVKEYGEYPYTPNYHHGTNVGLLVGHLDGSIKDCYVYKGELEFNDTEHYTPMASESQTLLIGEEGEGVADADSPEHGVGKGETGVMDITGIYKMIRTDFAKTSPYDTASAGWWKGTSGNKQVVSYGPVNATAQNHGKLNFDEYGSYKKYLRTDSSGVSYLTLASGVTFDNNLTYQNGANNYTVNTTTFNSIDFKCNQMIMDETGDDPVDRGLGVFRIATAWYDQNIIDADRDNYGQVLMGDSSITNTTAKTEVFFTTAELDRTKSGYDTSFNPLRATTLPEYSDVFSFEYPFSRDFNYCFRMDLSQGSDSDLRNYMWNTKSPFLTNYLSSKLIDKLGAPVEAHSDDFGFSFRKRDGVSALTEISSYIKVGYPGNKQTASYTVGDHTYHCPPNSIVFHIDNEEGANVSVIGNGDSNISIYSYDSSRDGNTPTRLYTMKSANSGKAESKRYFEYTYSGENAGVTGTTAVEVGNDMKDSGDLYAHIFKLTEPGDYVIGSSDSGKNANIYYLAVQGQNAGDYGPIDTYLTGKSVEDVDFLLRSPINPTSDPANPNSSQPVASEESSSEEYELLKAKFSLQAYFDSTAGSLQVLGMWENDRRYIKVVFNNGCTNTRYILARCQATNPYYKLNGQGYTTSTKTWKYESGG